MSEACRANHGHHGGASTKESDGVSELLPTVQAENVRRALVDYLTTTFALTDADARDGLDRFLEDPETGMFKGPYVRLRLPFRPGRRRAGATRLEWYEGSRRTGIRRRRSRGCRRASRAESAAPQPTLVTTGTGSGKTEAFLYPILDHVLRAKRRGRHRHQGADPLPDERAGQRPGAAARRACITEHPELAGITAALYTGQQGPAAHQRSPRTG